MKNSITETLLWLVQNGFPSLPVAPAQDPEKYPAKNKDGSVKKDANGNPLPLFTGKNPSFLDKAGIPRIVNHQPYQAKLPTQKDLDRWFANPQNGIGTLGGWNGIYWIDIDQKRFDSQEDCDRAFWAILEAHDGLSSGYWEQTHSGGYRLAVKLASKPGFTNFALEVGGKHIGEVLGKGRFTVLAPTVGPSGKAYTNHSRNYPVEIESLESIGIYPHGTANSTVANKTQKAVPRITEALPGSIPLELLATDDSRQVLNGNDIKGDRSASLTMAIREFLGWENWAHDNDISVRGTAEELAFHAGAQLGMDEARIERILSRIDRNCHPAAQEMGGDKSCWLRVRSLDKATYNAKCPDVIKKDVMPMAAPPSNDPNDPEARYRVTSAASRSDHHLNIHFFKEGKGDHCVIEAGFYKYKDGYWRHIRDEVLQKIITEELKKLYKSRLTKDGEEIRDYCFGGDGLVKSAINFNRSALWISPDDRECESYYLNFKNGVLDLRTGELIPHKKEFYLISQIQSDYVHNSDCPLEFKRFVEACYGLEKLEFLRAIIRYYIDPTMPYGKFVHPIGKSGSGKGALIRFLSDIHGDACTSTNDFTVLNTPEGRYRSLSGKRLMTCPDIHIALKDLGAFYELVDNGPLTGRPLYISSAPSRKWNVRFIVASTKPLQFENSSTGWDRRCIPLPTLPREGPQDPYMEDRIQACKTEVISWAMAMDREECIDYIFNAESRVRGLSDLKDAQAIASDSIRAFIDACLVPCDESDTELAKITVYGWYKAFCAASGLRLKSFNSFCTAMKEALPKEFEAPRSSVWVDGKPVNVPSRFFKIAPASPDLFPLRRTLTGETDPAKAEFECIPTRFSEGGLEKFRHFFDDRLKNLETLSKSLEVESPLSTPDNPQETTTEQVSEILPPGVDYEEF